MAGCAEADRAADARGRATHLVRRTHPRTGSRTSSIGGRSRHIRTLWCEPDLPTMWQKALPRTGFVPSPDGVVTRPVAGPRAAADVGHRDPTGAAAGRRPGGPDDPLLCTPGRGRSSLTAAQVREELNGLYPATNLCDHTGFATPPPLARGPLASSPGISRRRGRLASARRVRRGA